MLIIHPWKNFKDVNSSTLIDCQLLQINSNSWKALGIIFKNSNYIYPFTNQYNVEKYVLQLICTSVQKCAQKDIYWNTTGNTKYWRENHTFTSGEIMIVAHSCNRINEMITKVVLDRLLNEKTNQSIQESVPE